MIRLTAVIEIEGQASRALTHESTTRSITLGRDGRADFQIPLITISRSHARIEEQDGVYTIQDLGSTHGTIVNGTKLENDTKKVLQNGDVIELSHAKINCAIEGTDGVIDQASDEGTKAIAARAVEGILGRLGDAQSQGPYLRVLNGVDEGTRFSLSGSVREWSMGRSRDCEIVLNDANVSRYHALVRRDWHGYTVEDLGSKNGVVVNDARIQRVKRVHDRDEITVGPVKMVLIDPDADLLAALKDVPGFQIDDHDEVEGIGRETAPVVERTPEIETVEEVGEGASVPGEGIESQCGEAVDEGDPDNAAIDPVLLEPVSIQRSALEWAVIGVVGVVLVAAGVLLFVLIP